MGGGSYASPSLCLCKLQEKKWIFKLRVMKPGQNMDNHMDDSKVKVISQRSRSPDQKSYFRSHLTILHVISRSRITLVKIKGHVAHSQRLTLNLKVKVTISKMWFMSHLPSYM